MATIYPNRHFIISTYTYLHSKQLYVKSLFYGSHPLLFGEIMRVRAPSLQYCPHILTYCPHVDLFKRLILPAETIKLRQ